MKARLANLSVHVFFILSATLAGCATHHHGSETTMQSSTANNARPAQSGHAPSNGIRIYYEVHGSARGTPLVLLPGGGSTIDSTYGRILPYLARQRRVIAIDEQNHGRSEHRDIPERFTDSADDVAAVLKQLDIANADIMGFSNGASIAMQVVLRHPALVRKLVFAGSMTKRSGAPPQFWQGFPTSTFADMPQQLKDAFLKVNPDQRLLHDMYEKDVERMLNFVETSDEQVKSITVPTLVVAGDRDVSTPEHAVELVRLLPKAQLLILPGVHGEFLGEVLGGQGDAHYPELSSRLIERFLDADS
jgi:pimeloyl-ACP methyl ester carboxylesterase